MNPTPAPSPLAEQLLALVGGPGNVTRLTHCLARLRFELADPGLADDEAVQGLPDVLIVVRQSGQFQVALRIPVTDAYRQVREVLDHA